MFETHNLERLDCWEASLWVVPWETIYIKRVLFSNDDALEISNATINNRLDSSNYLRRPLSLCISRYTLGK